MKRLGVFSLMSLGAVLGLALLGAGCAHQEQASDRSQQQYLTGSYLPQDTQRNGPITNGKNDVRVWDQSDINRTGAATPGQALQQLGETH